MKNTADISRGIFFSTNNSVKSCNIKSLLILSLLNLALPAMSCGGNEESLQSEPPESMIDIELKSTNPDSDDTVCHSMDLFLFDEENHGTLDSYQRVDKEISNTVSVASRSGVKRLFACANGQWGRDDWMTINSMEALNGFKAEMENETYAFPVMTGEILFRTGYPPYDTLRLRRIASEIQIHSIKADFSGKGYEDEPLTDVRIYLINVNAGCSINAEGEIMPERIINHSGLDQEAMKLMREPGLIYRSVGQDLTSEVLYPDIRFRTFPNTCPEESPGSPFTRLVIEGQIKGTIYYWPIEIGRHEGRGIERNCLYIYDIEIRGKGNGNPDTPIGSKSLEFKLKVKEWEEKEEWRIAY